MAEVRAPPGDVYTDVEWGRNDEILTATRITRGNEDSVVVINGRTGAQRDLGDGDQASLSPDGTWAAVRRFFAQGGSGVTSIWRVDVKTGSSHLLVDGGSEPAISPNGRELAYASGPNQGEVAISSAAGGPARDVVAVPKPYLATDISWSPDGRWLAFVEYTVEKSRAYIVGVDGKGLRRIGEAFVFNGVFWAR